MAGPSSPATSSFVGYHTFADFVASDVELSVYKRFDRLSTRNLLYLQTELLEAERQLAEFDAEDNDEKNINVQYVAKCWETFTERAEEHSCEHARMEVVLRIRRLIREYRTLRPCRLTTSWMQLMLSFEEEALLLRSQVLKLKKPTNRVYKVFSNWFNRFRPFVGSGRRLLDDSSDFVTLATTEEHDRLSNVIQNLGGRYLPVGWISLLVFRTPC